jgi:PKD repeat protein
VRANSGGAGGATTTTPGTGGNPGTTTTSNSNVVLIAVGSGAIDTVTVAANPSTVSRTSNTAVTVTATVVGAAGRLLSGIPVSFSANRGTFSSNSAVTNEQGQALVTLTTNNDTTVTVVAGTKTGTVTITGRDGPSVTLGCLIGGAACSNVNPGQSVTFTAQRGGATSTIVSSSLDFGDGSSTVSLGSLASPATVPHIYNQAGTYTARLTATDVNGESTDDVEVVQVIAATVVVGATNAALVVTATATVSTSVSQYQWNFGDGFTTTTTANSAQRTYAGAGTYTIRVTAILTGGGTATGTTTITVP